MNLSADAPRPWCWGGCIVRSTILRVFLVLGHGYRAKHDPLPTPTSPGAPSPWWWDMGIVRSTILFQLRRPRVSHILGLGRGYRAKHDPLPTPTSAGVPHPWCWDGCIVRSTILLQIHEWQGVARLWVPSQCGRRESVLLDPGLPAPPSICAGPPGPSNSPRTRHPGRKQGAGCANRPPKNRAASARKPVAFSGQRRKTRAPEWEAEVLAKPSSDGVARDPIRSRSQPGTNRVVSLAGFAP
jgi:hypothetical protein